MIEHYKRLTKTEKLIKLKKPSKDSWIKVVDPSEDEIKLLEEEFKLDIDYIRDGLDTYENPRIEQDNGVVYVFLRTPISSSISAQEARQDPTSAFLFIFTKKNIITISKQNLEVFDKVSQSQFFFTDRSARILFMFMAYISKNFENSVRQILKLVKKDRRQINDLKEKDIFQLVIQEDMLNDYLSSFSPLIGIYDHILKVRSIKFNDDEKEYIEDLVIDLTQALTTCKNGLKSISNMRDYYSTTLTNNLNKVIGFLTVFTVFLTIPAVLSSIYGMNVSLPLQQNPNILFLLSGLVLGIWAILFFIFKKVKIF